MTMAKGIIVSLCVATLCILNAEKCLSTEEFLCYTCTDCPEVANSPKVNCEQKECYTLIDENGKVERGCQTANKTAETCTKSLCNKNIVCKQCDGIDTQCSQTDATHLISSVCAYNVKSCYTKIENMRVTRNCNGAYSDQCLKESDTCRKCFKSNCNTGIFPEGRLQCRQCSTADVCKEEINANQPAKPCLNYMPDDECFMFHPEHKTPILGCKSDAIDVNPCTTGANKAQDCTMCNGNDCNSELFREAMRLKCIMCEGSRGENSTCFKSADIEAKSCPDETTHCYTKFDGDVIQRGCYSDQMATDCETNCTTCSTNGCNNEEKQLSLNCIRCRSDQDEKCSHQATDLKGGRCRNGDGREKGCFYGIWNDVVIRGCMIDADLTMQYMCADNTNNRCRFCKEDNCNHLSSSLLSGASEISLCEQLLTLSILIGVAQFWKT